jgi:hypothetical protein
MNIVYNIQALTVTENAKFSGMHLDCNLTWKAHIDNLMKKLSSICFMLRKLLPTAKRKMLRMVYFAHFYSKIIYDIIFWGSSLSMRNVFKIQKRAIRITPRLGPRSSCREGFQKLDILTVPCLYTYVLMLFAVKNLSIYQNNTSVHLMNTRQQNNLHIPSVRLSSIQRGVYYPPLKISDQLTQNIFKFHYNKHIHKTLLREYLVKKAFYSIEQFLSVGHSDVHI